MDYEKVPTVLSSNPLRFVVSLSKQHYLWAIPAFFAVVCAELLSTVTPYLIKRAVDASQIADPVRMKQEVVFWALLYPVLLGLSFIFWRSSGFLGGQWSARVKASGYYSLFRHLSYHGHGFFQNRFAGSLNSKIANASEGAGSIINSFLWTFTTTFIELVVACVLVYIASPVLGVAFLLWILCMIPLNIYLARYRSRFSRTSAEAITKMRGLIVDIISNFGAVLNFARRPYELRQVRGAIEHRRRTATKNWFIGEYMLVINNVTQVVFTLGIIGGAIYLWYQGSLTIGDVVLVLLLVSGIQHSLTFIGFSLNEFGETYGEMKEGLSEVTLPSEITDSLGAKPLHIKEGQIEVKNISFAYSGQHIFKDLYFTVLPGQKVGLVGHSGAGKSTLAGLLLRQHNVDAGVIEVDGQDIAHVTLQSLREGIAYVPQEPILFHRSIIDNIRYGRIEATDEEVHEAARLAQAHDFILKLKEGYKTFVGERGVKLSGGERQRIAIARALLKNALILLLDEATSSLDSESEVAIQKALEVLMEGRTVIAIAHRLSTLRSMDRLIVLEEGKIIEDGTHESLLALGGVYATLWGHQAGGFITE